MLPGVVLTALYMTRQMLYVFFGPRRAAAAHAHESPSVMTLPLVVLAICASVSAWCSRRPGRGCTIIWR